jgi:uncharacterized protein YabN with tetrapyrrole methylase and pyrophosphatase domain
MSQGSLTVVGTGISAIGHVSLEARSHIESAGKVLYLVADPLTVSWIQELNSSAEDLYPLYRPDRDRLTTYFMITERILECLRTNMNVCAVFYGHPGVFVFPSHEAILRARREGFAAQMLPAKSAEDCLFADLGIDPGRAGCQTFEATDFLVHNRRIDTTCAVILWQVGIVGQIYNAVCKPANIQVLTDTLMTQYSPSHSVIIYEAKQYPPCDSRIERLPLDRLPETQLTALSTLFVPPSRRPVIDFEMAKRIGIPDNFVDRYADRPSLYDPMEPNGGLSYASRG